MKLPVWMTTVTPISKAIALGLMGGLPFFGFGLGVRFQKKATICPVRGSEIKIVRNCPTTYLLDRCGDYPKVVNEKFNGQYVIDDMSWSEDCRHIAWSQRRAPLNRNSLDNNEGLWLYTEKTGITEKLKIPPNKSLPMFLVWINNREIEFRQGEYLKIIDLDTGKVSDYAL